MPNASFPSNVLALFIVVFKLPMVEVTFTHNGETSGKYTDLRCDGFTYAPNTDEAGKEDGTYTVTIRLRTKNEIEKRLDSLEKGHIANATAIDSIITDIIPGMEDTEGAE